MRIIEIQSGKKKLELVVGLIWHPLQSSGSARAKEILGFAKTSGADLKVMRGTDSPHVGYAKKADGGKPGQISAAAGISDALMADGHRSVLVAMPLPDDHDTFVFISVRDGVILADGDATGTRDEIRVRLTNDYAYGGWDCVVCPAEWGMRDAKELDFESFFGADQLKHSNAWRLKETTLAWRKSVLPATALALIVLGGFYGWGVWQKKQAAAAMALRMQQEEKERGGQPTLTEPAKPWPTLPNVRAFTQACSKALIQAGLTAGNWPFDSAACEGGSYIVRWIKPNSSAWVSHLKLVHPTAVIANDGQSATVTLPAVAGPANDIATVLPPMSGLSARYHDLADRYGMSVQIEQPQGPVASTALPGQTQSAAIKAPVATWGAMQIRVTAKFNPDEVAEILEYPGLRFTRIAYSIKDGAFQYQFTGTQYVRLQ